MVNSWIVYFRSYYRGLEASLGLQAFAAGTWDEDQVAKLKALYKELLERFPRSAAAKVRAPAVFKSLVQDNSVHC